MLVNAEYDKNNKVTEKHSAGNNGHSPAMVGEGYFTSVHALSDYQLEVLMRTGSTIYFDFRPRLDTIRFGELRDKGLFQSVRTDGDYLIFEKTGKMPIKITASEFMDLVLIDRRR